jgi:voltage-gated potassium channel
MGVSLADGLALSVETLAYLGKQQKQGAALFVQLGVLHVGTLVTWYWGWLFTDLAMESHFLRHFRETRRMKKVESMHGHAVICGGGGVGAHIAETLEGRDEAFVIVEQDGETSEALRARGFLVATGDARDEETLRTAGVAQAKRLFAVLPEAEKNIVVALTASAMNASLEINARCERPDYVSKLVRAGAHRVTMPQVACAEQLVASAFAPEEDDSSRRLRTA